MPPAIAMGIGGLASLGGAAIGSSAAGDAADKQAAASKEANDLQWKMFQQQRADQDPYRQAGMSALYGSGGILRKKAGATGPNPADLAAQKEKFIQDRLNTAGGQMPTLMGKQIPLMQGSDLYNKYRGEAEQAWSQSPESQGPSQFGPDQYEVDPELTRSFTNDDFVKDPGYDFRMQEGQKALERSAAARGGLQSGGTMKALSKYGQDYASNEYQNAYNRFNNDKSTRFNRLSSLAGGGQTAATQLGNAGMNYANNVGQNSMGAANAQGAAGIAGANAWGGALSGLGNLGMQGAWMNQWNKSQGSGLGALGGTKMAGEAYFDPSKMIG